MARVSAITAVILRCCGLVYVVYWQRRSSVWRNQSLSCNPLGVPIWTLAVERLAEHGVLNLGAPGFFLYALIRRVTLLIRIW